MKQTLLFAILLNIFITSCTDRSGTDPSEEPVYLVTVKEPADEVTTQTKDGATVIEIYSSTGIGSAKFELESGDLPESIIIRLHLAGLEQVHISSEQTIVIASFSSSSSFSNNNQKLILLSGEESAIAPNHPLWMDIRVVSSEPAPNMPLEEGYFEIVFPNEFITESGNSFEIQWVDFYR